MIKVLFVCVHNSARSQMAEAFLNRLGNGEFYAESAGLEPGVLNPFVVKAMEEIGYDIKDNPTKSVFDFYREGRTYSYVIKVCDQMNGQRCPIFPGALHVIDWNLEDPAAFIGSDEEKLQRTREIRDQIVTLVEAFIEDHRMLITQLTNNSPEIGTTKISGNTTTIHLSNLDSLRVVDKADSSETWGVKSNWIDSEKQTLSKSQSVAATNYVLYVFRNQLKTDAVDFMFDRNQCSLLMEEVSRFLNLNPNEPMSTARFINGLHEFADHKGFNIHNRFLNISGDLKHRVNVSPYVSFIEKSLKTNLPVSFYVLGKGDEPLLSDQTWYTILSLSYTDDFKQVSLEVIDDGEKRTIDALNWYLTSKEGGGFVSSVLEK